MQPLQSGGDVRTDWRGINQLNAELQSALRRIHSLEHPNHRLVITGGTGAAGGGGWRGEWSATEQYVAGEIVIFTPSGGQAGAYGVNEDPPIGTAPDTGAPYFTAFPLQTPAVWA